MLEALRAITPETKLTGDEVFEAVFEAGSSLALSDREDGPALEIAIRLLEARQRGQLPAGADKVVEYLAEECGLYPYIDPANFGLITQSVIEAHSVNVRGKLYLHSKQMQALLWLLGGDNVILSAPTSFGKSLLVDAFIARKYPFTVVMILPTIALIDETRRRLTSTFGNLYTIITTATDEYDSSKPTIFILTQERLLNRKHSIKIDLLFVDEFYKLDPDRDDGRFETLNLALYRFLPLAKQCFMAGPHVRSIQLGDGWKGNFRFVKTDYKTVTVNIIDRSAVEKRFEAFLHDLKGVGLESSLVFTATPGTAQELLEKLVEAGVGYPAALPSKLSEWISTNYHADWSVAQACKSGMAVHHGRISRSLGQLFVQLFDQGEIRVLICTSTLIEGVNTAAANVFVYDKKINRTDFDFFSFANIRGRVGRMMRHFVGNAFLYHEPPEEVDTDVIVPVLSSPDSSTDYVVMNVDAEQLGDIGRARQEALLVRTGLPEALLREHGGLGTDLLVRLTHEASEALSKDPSSLMWTGFPDKEQRIAIAELVVIAAQGRRDQTGIHTARQIGWAWSQLAQIQSLPGFLRWFARTFGREGVKSGVDAAFQFLQACEFSFPRTLSAVEAILLHLRPGAAVSYSAYIASMEGWFRPAWIKQLDEAGIPIPLAERLRRHLVAPTSRADALAQIRNLTLDKMDDMDDVDRFILRLALS